MPLFSKKGGDDGKPRDGLNEDDNSDATPSAQPPVDEHTRLLPNRVDSNRGMLSPDDPAVTPYNLWTIRILRVLTVAFAILSLVWWTLLLVSIFATPPGLHTKGSPFYALGYATLALVNMLLTIVFFGVPARSVRILAVAMAVILFINTIVTVSVQKTRYEEGWVGIVSVIWALHMSLWTLIADRAVQWGKAEEEERLTGRAETRRSLAEWLEVLVSTIGYAVMALAAVLVLLTTILRALDASTSPPGHLYWVDGGKYQIHVYCRGNKTDARGTERPTVLFEAGENSVEHGMWALADHAVESGSISRYCFADRPGMAWSDTGPSPLSASFATDALSEALSQAGEHGPWVLASAGIGSIYQRIFSSRHGSEVEAMVLIDPLHEYYLGRIGSAGRGFLFWLRGFLSPLGLDRLPGALFKGRTSRDRIHGRSEHQDGKFLFAKLQENLVAGSFTKREVEGSREIQHRDTALVVVSSGEHIKNDDNGRWADCQKDLTTLTDNLKHWDIVDGAPHEVWLTREGRDAVEARLRQLVHGET